MSFIPASIPEQISWKLVSLALLDYVSKENTHRR